MSQNNYNGNGSLVAMNGQYPPMGPIFPGPYGGFGAYPMGPFGPPVPAIPPPYPSPFIRPFRGDRNCSSKTVSGTLVTNQLLTGDTTNQQILVGVKTSTDGDISAGSLVLPKKGTYTVSFTVTVNRPTGSTVGDVLFSVSGGSSTINIAGGTVAENTTQIFSGTVTLTFTSTNGTVSIFGSNNTTGAGSVTVTQGSLSAVLQ